MSIFPGPTPPESNPPINPQYYAPRRYVISDIYLGPTTSVTTTIDNDYVVGQLVRLIIPFGYGSNQLNNQEAYVIDIPTDDTVILDIDSQNYDYFNPSFTGNLTLPQIIAIGDIGNGTTNGTGNVNESTFIPGSFINISPQ
jgi:hypothetical protein